MDRNTLKQANELSKKISDLEKAWEAFEFEFIGETFSLHPSLIIEHDDCDGGRSNTAIPAELSMRLVQEIKKFIIDELVKTKKEFDLL